MSDIDDMAVQQQYLEEGAQSVKQILRALEFADEETLAELSRWVLRLGVIVTERAFALSQQLMHGGPVVLEDYQAARQDLLESLDEVLLP